MIDEDVSRRTIALSMRTGKLTARVLAYALRAAGRKIQKERRAHQTPHGRQSVKKLMAHGAATNSIELTGAPSWGTDGRRRSLSSAIPTPPTILL